MRKPYQANDMKLPEVQLRRSPLSSRGRRGFTLTESLITIVVFSTMLSIGLPRANSQIRHRRVIAASNAVNAAIPQAFSLAARERKPVTLTYDAASGEIRIRPRSSVDTVYARRALGSNSEYKLESVTMTPSSVQIFPNGTSSSAFTIRLTNGSFVRQLNVGRTGLSRVTTY